MINDGLCGASARAAAKTGVILSLCSLSMNIVQVMDFLGSSTSPGFCVSPWLFLNPHCHPLPPPHYSYSCSNALNSVPLQLTMNI